MNWDEDLFAMFDDLESQAEAAFGVERDAEVLDRARADYGAVTLTSRLMASREASVELTVIGPGLVRGRLARVAEEWVLVAGHGQEWVVPVRAIAAARGLSDRSLPEAAWPAAARLGVASALRRLAEAQERCLLHLRDGSSYDVVPGRVGRDFVEAGTGHGTPVLIGLAELSAVQSRPEEIAL